MTTLLRSIRLLSIVFWEGSLLFFAFVLAPTAFGVLPSKHLAGLVVGGTLVVLHHIGIVCGGLFLSATLLLPASRAHKLQIALIVVMIAVTAYLQFSVVPAMERDRIQVGGDVDAAPAGDPARVDFERLHPLSEKIEGVALFAGLGVVLLMATEPSSPKTIDS